MTYDEKHDCLKCRLCGQEGKYHTYAEWIQHHRIHGGASYAAKDAELTRFRAIVARVERGEMMGNIEYATAEQWKAIWDWARKYPGVYVWFKDNHGKFSVVVNPIDGPMGDGTTPYDAFIDAIKKDNMDRDTPDL